MAEPVKCVERLCCQIEDCVIEPAVEQLELLWPVCFIELRVFYQTYFDVEGSEDRTHEPARDGGGHTYTTTPT